MANHLVSWPAGQTAEAETYRDACNVHWAANYEPGGIASYVREDRFGQPTAPLYDEYFMHSSGFPEFVEPAELLALRAGAVKVELAQWPEEEE